MHPQLNMIIVEDALHSNAPHIQLLRSLDYQYIIGVKPADHAWLFDWVKVSKPQTFTLQRGDKQHRYEWVNDASLNESCEDMRVNFIEYWETNIKTGKTIHFTWVTSFHITHNNIVQLVKGARARWKIENETFNTLKNQGYHFGHNFGHGYEHLSTVFTHLMMLAFLVDQLQQLCCPIFQKALAVCLNKKKNLWERMRHFFMNCIIMSWEAFFHVIIHKPRIVVDMDTT